ncbi:hypothetical protein [Noviherbaspirillum galbum]|uniref:Uncharacterized protein n=1 Tax=Noviherbaspirillum galbum TaxID=2709383 RepID=A0A6B3SYP9_9BURK|nr:hypothetical protein [Noviherbaspirillum galbum]NEX64656.1 hypothetical protein [Noviherbaspirillum galbum]
MPRLDANKASSFSGHVDSGRYFILKQEMFINEHATGGNRHPRISFAITYEGDEPILEPSASGIEQGRLWVESSACD